MQKATNEVKTLKYRLQGEGLAPKKQPLDTELGYGVEEQVMFYV